MKSKDSKIDNTMKSQRENNEKLICEIFTLCDQTVWLEDWLDFQKSFEKILKKFGYDLYPIYFGKTKSEFKKQQKKIYDKWVADKEKANARKKKPVAYIKDTPQSLEVKRIKRK